jgi:two-component system, chemotaxis family, protein-glutamate methylesterase/glutaminase
MTQPPSAPAAPRLRVLVVDDSAYNRRNISDIFASHPDTEVVGRAGDGEEALRLVATLKPDVITLDLEMPRMDGFTFLRILMAKQPVPVVVVSSYRQKENVFKALELGAVDFVAKPNRQVSPDADGLRKEILEKVLLVRTARAGKTKLTPLREPPPEQATKGLGASLAPRHIVGVASSTGGPSALLEIVGRLHARSLAALLVAQHMPDKFTRTFAERLDRRGAFQFSEAQDGDVVWARRGFVCPGRQCMEVVLAPTGEFRLRTGVPGSNDRYVPSADRMLRSLAIAAGPRVVAVILTGMGDDGTAGARAVREAGGVVIAESEETAVVNGMPGSVVREGLANYVLPLPQIAAMIAALP